MNDETATVVDKVRAARESAGFDQQITRIKKAVGDEMRRLDPGLTIQTTDYFNHSYVPDLVAKWREDGKARERGVFIRGSLRTVLASDDMNVLSAQAPVVVGISDEPEDVWDSLRRQAKKSNRTLATEVATTARIRGDVEDSKPEYALSSLVRANLLRGGRGILDDEDADNISTVEDREPLEALKVFSKTVRDLFVGKTASRLSRTAGLLQTFFASDDTVSLEGLRERPLTEAELQVVLPFVIGRADEVTNASVWDVLAGMLSLESIESMSRSLDGLDLTRLVRPVTRSLIAGRAGLYSNPRELTDEELDNAPPTWTVRSGRLVADVRRWSVYFGSNARKVRGHDSGPDARWDELSAPLRDFVLVGAELKGLTKTFSLETTAAASVRADIESVRASIDDDYHVRSVSVRADKSEDAPTVNVLFEEATATGLAPIDLHLRAAGLLAVKRPIASEDLKSLLVRSE